MLIPYKKSLCGLAVLSFLSAGQAKVVDADSVFAEMKKKSGLGKVSASAKTAMLEKLARNLEKGDDLYLPTSSFGNADFSELPDGVSLMGGKRGSGTVYLGGRHENLTIMDCEIPITVGPLKKGGLAKSSSAQGQAGLFNSHVINSVAIAGGPFNDSYFLETNTFGRHKINGAKNSVFVYFDYNVSGCSQGLKETEPKASLTGDFSNSRIYHMVETNYCMKEPSVHLNNVTGPLTFLVGDTERAYGIVYKISNSTGVVLGTHRMMATSNAKDPSPSAHPPVSILFENGSDNKLLYSQDIASPSGASLVAASEKNFEVWGGFWEKGVQLAPDALQVFSTPKGYGPNHPVGGGFVEPVQTQDEVVFNYQGKNILEKANQDTPLPKPPPIPATGMPDTFFQKFAEADYMKSPDFGQALLAAGADPTGVKPADDAIEKVLQENSHLEIPKGTFLVTKPIRFRNAEFNNNGSKKSLGSQGIHGAGPESILKAATNDFSVLKWGSFTRQVVEGFKKAAKGRGQGLVSNLTVDGGKWALDLSCDYAAAQRIVGLHARNQSLGGVAIGNGVIGAPGHNSEGCRPHEFDQNRFINCTFINTGDYGIYNNMNMVDKGLLINCHFKGQNKAGYFCGYTTMFNSSIIQCKFEDINGPAIDLYPAYQNASQFLFEGIQGYSPHLSMIESSEFINCGNETRAAIEYGWTESNSISNSKIIINNKKWKYAYRGTAQYMYNVEINADPAQMVPGGAAIGLFSTRRVKNSRPMGNILNKVKTTTPTAYLDNTPDFMKMETYFPAFKNTEWSHPNLFVDCEFGPDNMKYSLVPGKMGGGWGTAIHLQPGTIGLKPDQQFARGESKDLEGFLIAADGRVIQQLRRSKISQFRLAGANAANLNPGTYFWRSSNGKDSKPVVLLP